MASDSQPGHYRDLDGLRGVAIGLVLVLHTVGGAHVPWLGRAAKMGWVGVDLFFVLSGFLITRILLRTRQEPRYFVDFYGKRALRIWPLYYGILVFAYTVAPAIMPFDTVVNRLAYYATFSQNWFLSNEFGGWPVRVTWSLAIEEQFYLIWPLLVRLLSERALLRLALLILALSPVARLLAACAGILPITIHIGTPFRFDGLAAGALVALFANGRAHLPAAWRAPARMVAAGCLLASAVLVFTCLDGDAVLISAAAISTPAAAAQSVVYSFLAIGFGALLLWTRTEGASLLRRLLVLRPAVFFGTISYGLYLIHGIVIPVIHVLRQHYGDALESHGHKLAMLAMVVCIWALSIGLATASWFLLERPVLSLRRYFTPEGRQARRAAEAPSSSRAAVDR